MAEGLLAGEMQKADTAPVEDIKTESKPDSVVMIGDKAFVGVDHGSRANVNEKDKPTLERLAKQYGVWYEGSGGDVESTGFFGPQSAYAGSWDDKFAATVKGHPPEFLYTLFTNVDANKQDEVLTNPDKTIFESIMSAQDAVSPLKGRTFDKGTLQKFLSKASQEGVDFVDMAAAPATPENVEQFLRTGEKLMWPDEGWENYPNPAGKLAQRANEMRQEFLLSQPGGVYVVGSDHLQALKKRAEPDAEKRMWDEEAANRATSEEKP